MVSRPELPRRGGGGSRAEPRGVVPMGLRSPGGEEDLPGFTREAPPMRRLRDPPGQEIRAGQHLGHFARVEGERRCGHEAETVDQRDAKLALLEALRRALCGGPEGWRIGAELPLADGRRRPGGRSYARGSAAASSPPRSIFGRPSGGCSRARTRPRGWRIARLGRSRLSSRASARKFSSNS